MARCPDCNKFVSLEAQDPEVSLDLYVQARDTPNPSFEIEAQVRIVLACDQCGTEVKSYDFSCQEDITGGVVAYLKDRGHTLADHPEEPPEEDEEAVGHEAEVDEGDAEATSETVKRVVMHGFSLGYEVRCSCGETLYEGSFADSVASSELEDC